MWNKFLLIIIVVIFIAPYLTDRGEHTTLYKNNNNVYIKTSKIVYDHNIVFLTHACAHTRTHTHTHAQKNCNWTIV